MTNHECNSSKYDWKDNIIIVNNAPSLFRPEEHGVICGISRVQSEEAAKKYSAKLGDWLYNIEFSDGSTEVIVEIESSSF